MNSGVGPVQVQFGDQLNTGPHGLDMDWSRLMEPPSQFMSDKSGSEFCTLAVLKSVFEYLLD